MPMRGDVDPFLKKHAGQNGTKHLAYEFYQRLMENGNE